MSLPVGALLDDLTTPASSPAFRANDDDDGITCRTTPRPDVSSDAWKMMRTVEGVMASLPT